MKNYLENNLLLSLLILVSISTFFSFSNHSQAYSLGCSEYGMAYEDYSGYCKCMSGYVMGKSLGNPYCVSGSSVCYDKYGYGSSYDSLSGSCECSYGYVFGKDSIGRTQCISETDSCQSQYGYNSRSTYGGKCECSYGYIFNDSKKCEYGNTVCSREHGIYASYDSLSNKCVCDSGYTIDDSNQCVKKQNNVYFTVKELDTDAKKTIIKSDYDYGYYLISYNAGCYANSFKRYLNHQIVVNLGTDFYLDTWDKIVLQDDDETCDITHREKVDSSFSLEAKEDPIFYIAPTIKPNSTTPTSTIAPNKPKPVVNKVDTQIKKDTITPNTVKVEPKEEIAPTINPEPVKKLKWYQRLFNWVRGK